MSNCQINNDSDKTALGLQEDELCADRLHESLYVIRVAGLLIAGLVVVGSAYTHRLELGQRLQRLASSHPNAKAPTHKYVNSTASTRDASLGERAEN